jgi:hypothetical protein
MLSTSFCACPPSCGSSPSPPPGPPRADRHVHVERELAARRARDVRGARAGGARARSAATTNGVRRLAAMPITVSLAPPAARRSRARLRLAVLGALDRAHQGAVAPAMMPCTMSDRSRRWRDTPRRRARRAARWCRRRRRSADRPRGRTRPPGPRRWRCRQLARHRCGTVWSSAEMRSRMPRDVERVEVQSCAVALLGGEPGEFLELRGRPFAGSVIHDSGSMPR